MDFVIYLILAIIVIYTIAMIPLQYNYIVALDKKEKKAGSQQKAYDLMSFEELNLHFNIQSNALNFVPNFIAYLIFKHKNK